MAYTYILEWTKLGKRYIGGRWAVGCHPSDLWKKYFTSSEYVREFVAANGAPDIILIDQVFDTAQEAMARELFLLRQNEITKNDGFLNKGILGVYNPNDPDIRRRNHASQIGKKRSPETCKKISDAKKGSKPSPETRAAMSKAHKGNQYYKGKKHSPEWIEWVTEFHRTRKRSHETNAKISAALTGKKLSEEHKQKARVAALGLKHSVETKKVMSEQRKGNKYRLGTTQSEETRALMSAQRSGKKHQIVECPHCSKAGGSPSMHQWHFDNCKHRKTE